MFKIAAGKKRDASVRPPRPRQTKERTEIFQLSPGGDKILFIQE